MIKVTTESGTEYIIDKNNGNIKRVPRPGTTFDSILRGFTNVGEFQPYNSLEGLEVGKRLIVVYPDEQKWSLSTIIIEIDYDYEEDNHEQNI